MSSKQSRPTPGKGAPAGRPGAGGRRPASSRQAGRGRQLAALAAVGVVLLGVAAFVVLSQPKATELVADRHALGNPGAPVLVTEWSDFQ